MRAHRNTPIGTGMMVEWEKEWRPPVSTAELNTKLSVNVHSFIQLLVFSEYVC